MPKRTPTTGEKNLIGKRLIELRRQHHMWYFALINIVRCYFSCDFYVTDFSLVNIVR